MNDRFSDEIVLLMGNGDGTFGLEHRYAAHAFLRNLNVGDFNGDGLRDIGYGTQASPYGIGILLNNGDGTFGDAIFTEGDNYTRLFAYDFNQDGFDDFVASDFSGIKVFLGDGVGSFEERHIYQSFAIIDSVEDLDGDGISDIIFRRSQSIVFVFLSNDDGTFRGPFNAGVTSNSGLAILDFNKDQIPDLINFNPPSIWLGNGDGTFKEHLDLGDRISSPQEVHIADMDNNGVEDIVLSYEQFIEIGLRNADGLITAWDKYLNRYEGNSGITVKDFNQDEFADLIVIDQPFDEYASGGFTLYLNRCAGKQVSVQPNSLLVTRGVSVSSDVNDLLSSDDVDLSIRRSNIDVQSIIEFEIESVCPVDNPSTMAVMLEGSVFSRTTVDQTIELFNFDTSVWETVDSRLASRFNDSLVTAHASGNLSRFIQNETRSLRARVRFKSINPRRRFASNSDQLIWSIGE